MVPLLPSWAAVDIAREAPKKGRKRLIMGGAAVLGIALVTVALGQLEPAAPSVEAGTVWPDTVRRGTMLREVRGPGTLVPEQVRWVSAVTAGRVERILLDPGAEVEPETVLLEMSNPEVQLEALQAQQQLSAAEASLVNTRTTLETGLLAQQAAVAAARTNFNDAERQANVSDSLVARGLISLNEAGLAKDRLIQMRTQLEVEEKRLKVMGGSIGEQIRVEELQVERLQQVVSYQQRLIQSMRVAAGAPGVLRDLPLEEGQWVLPGTRLARVVQPGRLKAELRIPETQARDVVVGQRAMIDMRTDTMPGHVIRVDPASENGSVVVEVALEGELARGARPDLQVDGTIEIERLENVLYTGRPAYGQSNSIVGIFRMEPGGKAAQQVRVRLGRTSVQQVEIVDGLREGDVVILSDMSRWETADRVRIR